MLDSNMNVHLSLFTLEQTDHKIVGFRGLLCMLFAIMPAVRCMLYFCK